MRIIVDELPKTPRECIFSRVKYFGDKAIYICGLHQYIPEADKKDDGYKPECICKSVSSCNLLAREVF